MMSSTSPRELGAPSASPAPVSFRFALADSVTWIGGRASFLWLKTLPIVTRGFPL